MSLPAANVNGACAEYDRRAAEAERILRQVFPRLWWHVARYQALVLDAKIRPDLGPPGWLLIQGTKQSGGHASQCLELDLSFFAHVNSPTALLTVAGQRLANELAPRDLATQLYPSA